MSDAAGSSARPRLHTFVEGNAVSDLMRQVIVVVWPGLGVGATEGSTNGRTRSALGYVASYVGGLEAPTLQWLGLGNVARLRGVDPAAPPAASHGRLATSGLEALVGQAARALLGSGRQVHLVGAAADELQVAGAQVHAAGTLSAIEQAADLAQGQAHALIVAMPAAGECPTSGSPVTAARAVRRLDAELARLFDRLQGREDVMVMVTSDSGQATGGVSGSGPQWAPILAHLGALPSGIALGDRGAGDLGATAAEALGASATHGVSFLAELLA